jgi:hypothetical protein
LRSRETGRGGEVETEADVDVEVDATLSSSIGYIDSDRFAEPKNLSAENVQRSVGLYDRIEAIESIVRMEPGVGGKLSSAPGELDARGVSIVDAERRGVVRIPLGGDI